MALSAPIGIFGIHSITPYNLSTGLPYGLLRVLGSITIGNEVDLVELMGGSSRDAWAVEVGKRDVKISVTAREYADFLWEIMAGKAVTTTAGEALGGVVPLVNVLGTSVFKATTGIATVLVLTGSEADIKYGGYIVKCVTATTVDVYALTDVDFAQGALLDYANDALKITATPLTVAMGAAVNIPSFGLKLTGGSGTIGMTVGDTAYFAARPENTGYATVAVGTKDERFVPFGMLVQAQRKSDGTMFAFNFYKVQGAGMPANMKEQSWSEYEMSFMPIRSVPAFSLTGATSEGLYEYQRIAEIAA